MTYNSNVPTPFNHLVIAEAVLREQHLPSQVRRRLSAERPAFMLGNTAPDVSTITGLSRAATHFFDVPMVDRSPAHRRMLKMYPDLVDPSVLPPDQAAFLAGYLAHLWLDQAWIAGVFEPVFGPDVDRGRFQTRLLAHNLLRAHLDERDRNRLDEGIGRVLRSAKPGGWLPFVSDDELSQWRDHLAGQLPPDGSSKTVAVFASRHGIDMNDFSAQLASRATMQQQVFRHLPPRRLKAFDRLGSMGTAAIVREYMTGQMGRAPISHQPFRYRLAGKPTTMGAHHESHRTL